MRAGWGLGSRVENERVVWEMRAWWGICARGGQCARGVDNVLAG